MIAGSCTSWASWTISCVWRAAPWSWRMRTTRRMIWTEVARWAPPRLKELPDPDPGCFWTQNGANYNYLHTCKSYGPVHNGFHADKSITRGVGPWNSRYLWVKLHEPLGECHLGPTNIPLGSFSIFQCFCMYMVEGDVEYRRGKMWGIRCKLLLYGTRVVM